MRRHLLALVAGVAAVLLFPVAPRAEPSGPPTVKQGQDIWVANQAVPAAPTPGTGAAPAGSRRGAPPGPVTGYVWWHLGIVERPGGMTCWQLSTDLRPDPPRYLNTQAVAQGGFADLAHNGMYNEACPPERAGPAFDPAAAARRYWEEVVAPPTPEPLRIAPGYAVTGLLAYLEIGGNPNPSWTLDNPIGPDILITARPRYVVHWGERDAPRTRTTSKGRPWPGGAGEITYSYRYQGTARLRVDAYWTGAWRLSGEAPSASRPLSELAEPTTARLDLPVRQVQAVRNR